MPLATVHMFLMRVRGIAEHGLGSSSGTEVARYLTKSGLLKEKPDLIRMDVMQEDADEVRLIEGIKLLIS